MKYAEKSDRHLVKRGQLKIPAGWDHLPDQRQVPGSRFQTIPGVSSMFFVEATLRS